MFQHVLLIYNRTYRPTTNSFHTDGPLCSRGKQQLEEASGSELILSAVWNRRLASQEGSRRMWSLTHRVKSERKTRTASYLCCEKRVRETVRREDRLQHVIRSKRLFLALFRRRCTILTRNALRDVSVPRANLKVF